MCGGEGRRATRLCESNNSLSKNRITYTPAVTKMRILWLSMVNRRWTKTPGRLNTMNWRKPGARVIFGLFVFCLSLDIFTCIGARIAPDAVGRAICMLRPLGFFAEFLFSHDWSSYAANSCARFPSEPAISIVAFMLKLSVVVLGLVTTITMFPLREGPIQGGKEAPASSIERGSNAPDLGGWILPLILFVLPVVFIWWVFASKSPNDFQVSPLFKAYEDGFLFGLFGAGVIAWLAFVELALLPVLRWWFPKVDWIRTQ